MKVLFVYKYYGEKLANSVIDFQRSALIKEGAEINDFHITGNGVLSYVKAIRLLRKTVKKQNYNLIHAHYNFSGFASSIATSLPVICSLMGSDVYQQGKILKKITRFFAKHCWKLTIVKTNQMQAHFPSSVCIPNGVDLNNFKPLTKKECQEKVGFKNNKRHVLFLAQAPNSQVKNLALLKKALDLINNPNIKLHILSGKTFTELPYYYNAADMVALTSLTEGSPNVIKEAMACNVPIVATNVGDIKEILDETEGTYITTFEPEDLADKIKLALKFKKRTVGRNKVQHLDNKIIAKKIIEVYKQCYKNI